MQEIGLQLKKQREEKGLALADIEKSTKISIRLLKNIEAGEFNSLPSGIFARNFVHQYCLAIGVEPEPILEKIFKPESEPVEEERYSQKNGHWGLAFVVILIVILGAVGYWGYQQGLFRNLFPAKDKTVQTVPARVYPVQKGNMTPAKSNKTMTGKEAEAENRASAEKTVPVPPVKKLPEKAKVTLPENKKELGSGTQKSVVMESTIPHGDENGRFSVRFEADEKCWIHLRCPEKEMDFILMSGEMYTISCSSPAVVTVGNAEHLRVFVNNKKVVFPAGQRVVKNFVLGNGENAFD